MISGILMLIAAACFVIAALVRTAEGQIGLALLFFAIAGVDIFLGLAFILEGS